MKESINIKSKLFIPSSTSIMTILIRILLIITFLIILIMEVLMMVKEGFNIFEFAKILLAFSIAFKFYPTTQNGVYITTNGELIIEDGKLYIYYKNIQLGKKEVKDICYMVKLQDLKKVVYNKALLTITFWGTSIHLDEKEQTMPQWAMSIVDGNIEEIRILVEKNSPTILEYI